MAVTECKIHKKRARFSIDAESAHVVNYRIRTDAVADPVDVFGGARTSSPDPLPKEYDVHPQDSGAYVLSVDIQAQTANDFKAWDATVTYGPLPPGQDPDRADNPLLWPVRYRMGYKMVSREVTRDADGRPIVSTARRPVARPPRIDYSVPVLFAEKNYATFAEIIALQLQFDQTASDAEWFGAPAGSAQFETITMSDLKTRGGIEYYTGTHQVIIDYLAGSQPAQVGVDNLSWEWYDRDPDWVAPLGTEIEDGDQVAIQATLGEGFDVVGNESANLVPVHGEDGQPLQNAQYLSPEGQSGKAGGLTIYKVYYDVKPRIDYGELGIGG